MNSKTRKERFVVVGGCAAGMSAASKAKRLRPEMEVIALEKSPHVSYSACGIPYYISDLVRDAGELVTMTPDDFRGQRGIDVRVLHEVVAISPTKRQVTALDIRGGTEICLDYDQILIAVGGCPRIPMDAGLSGTNVFSIQTLRDGIAIKGFIDTHQPKRAVIIGAGYIGMEMAEACRTRGLKTVIIEHADRILSGFEPEVSERVQAELTEQQVRVLTGVAVTQTQIEATRVSSVTLSNGDVLTSCLVLICAGVTPNTRLAKMAGARLGRTGAVAVDWKMRTCVNNVYAAGDCVEVKNLVSGRPDYIPLGPTANKQGRVAGENVGGGTARFRGVVGTSVFKVFDLAVARTGLGSAQAKQLGFDAGTVTTHSNARASYFPRGSQISTTVIFDQRGGRLLGAQMVGNEGVSKRIDLFAAALLNKMDLDEMTALDLSYAPPFAPVWDPVLVAVNVARGKLKR